MALISVDFPHPFGPRMATCSPTPIFTDTSFRAMALNDVSVKIGVGEHVAILGPNGCGKSTLIKAITRECYPLIREGSSVRILGEERWNVAELRTLLGIVSSDLMTTCTRSVSGREIVLSGFFSSIGIWPHQEVTT